MENVQVWLEAATSSGSEVFNYGRGRFCFGERLTGRDSIGNAAGDSRAHPTGRLITCCLLYRARLQACNACSCPRTDVLGYMGTDTLIDYQLT